MSCKHCTPIEGDGPFTYEEYILNDNERALIEPHDDKFLLIIMNISGDADGSDTAEIKIHYCPWCGDKLRVR